MYLLPQPSQYADVLCGPETTAGESSGSDASDQECGDIETAVTREIQSLKVLFCICRVE